MSSLKQPEILVERFPSEKDWTRSEFFIKGIREGVGIEDELRAQKVKGETRIPNDIYEFDLRTSPKFSKAYFVDKDGYLSPTKDARFTQEHQLIWVKNVPNFEFVLWHWGNTDDDTDGCYIVGKDFATFTGQRGVSGSRATYIRIYPLIYQIIKANQAAGLKTFGQYRDKLAA